MKKFLILAMAVLGMAFGISAQNRSIYFIEGKTFAEIKELAKKENKLIFLDFYTSWCGWCKVMDKKTFTNDSVADYFNEHFISARIDAEKGEGVKLAKRYDEIHAFPTFLFLSVSGEMIHRSAGYMVPKEFIQFGNDALDPGKQISQLIDTYFKGKKDAESAAKILDRLSKIGLSSEMEKIIADYLVRNKDQDVDPEMERRIVTYTSDVNSSGFQFILRNCDKLLASRGDSIIKTKIISIFLQEIWKVASDTTISREIKLAQLEDIVKKANPSNKEWLDEVGLLSYLFSGDWSVENWSKFSPLIDSGLVERLNWYSRNVLHSCAANMHEYVTDEIKLQRAVQWIKRSIKLKESPENLHTFALLLFKLGEFDSAIEMEAQVLELAQKQKYSEIRIRFFEDELQKFKKQKVD